MNILINASNLRVGGGVQVADSICRNLSRFPEISFTVILSDAFKHCGADIEQFANVEVVYYNQPLNIRLILTGRDQTLDDIVYKKKIDGVLTVFGPSRWHPKCFHLCGFAMPHLILTNSPYWNLIKKTKKWKQKIRNIFMNRDFKRNNNILWSETEYISSLLRKQYKGKDIITVTNNYNQIFDNPSKWGKNILFPNFDGFTFLTVSANYPHKNLSIAVDAIEILSKIAPNIKVRFVFTIEKEQYREFPKKYIENFLFLGKVNIEDVPNLYKQADGVFLPSLLECFSANYVEAMKMRVPILTTDLDFARSLCGDAALYFESINPSSLANNIIRLVTDTKLYNSLIEKGCEQLKNFDSNEIRADKLIRYLVAHCK